MKNIVIIMLLMVLFTVNKAHAQTEQTVDTTIVAGHFEINVVTGGDTSHINVNYAMSPAPFTNNMSLELSTPDPIFLNIDIQDASNTTLISWAPGSSSNYYSHSIDISSLPAGNYHMNIHRDNSATVLNSVNFTKS